MLLHQLVERLARPRKVPGLQLRFQLLRERPDGRRQRQREEQRDHFTSSS